MKDIIDSLIISLFIITNYMSVLAVIALSPATEVGKIMGLQMVQTMLDEFEEAYCKEARANYGRLIKSLREE